jgi:2-dehydropantoate 2-reductase
MRVLVVGAGALGGYFGGCLVKAGRDVAFLARGRRAGQLAADGLRITGPHISFAGPVSTVLAGSINETFDLVLLAVKAYGLDEAMRDMAPAIGPATVILPVLNGMSHIDALSSAFGAERVFGGMAQISAAMSADGLIDLGFSHAELVFGELNGGTSVRASAISEVLTVDGFSARLSAEITQDMWEKWMIVGTVAGCTCLMRASIGEIIAAGGQEFLLRFFTELRAIGAAVGFEARSKFIGEEMPYLTNPASGLKASMLRDIERGSLTEGDHMLGQLVALGRKHGVSTPSLDLAHCHVAAYEVVRSRQKITDGSDS